MKDMKDEKEMVFEERFVWISLIGYLLANLHT
jgi:hypothetical protein